jgi:uncharacterized iron-regulated membrane protein
MSIKKITGYIHLWLGLACGLVIVILGITGCLLVFEIEIRKVTEPFRNVEVQNLPLLPPSVLKAKGEAALVSKKALVVEYGGPTKAAIASYYDAEHYELVYMNPYTGEVQKHKNMNRDFFRVVLNGHYYLWLPPKTGQPIVASATLVFLLMLITGIVLWWPKNRLVRKQRFTIKWNASWRRKNYDLHSVLGFYMSWVAIFLVVTGLVFGFQWFAKAVYWVSSGGKTLVEHADPLSGTPANLQARNIADQLWKQHQQTLGSNDILQVYFPATATSAVEIIVNRRPGTYYKTDVYHYDQYSGKPLKAAGSWHGKFNEASTADKIVRMNYDIHVGAILGLPGKLLAFFASLIAASLPVTGFMIWYGRKKKKKAGSTAMATASVTQ